VFVVLAATGTDESRHSSSLRIFIVARNPSLSWHIKLT